MTGRPKKASLHFKGKTWYARFYNAKGQRKFSSLQTGKEFIANSYIKQIEALYSDPSTPCSERVHKIFFDEDKALKPTEPIRGDGDELLLQVTQYQIKIKEQEEELIRLRDIELKYNAIMRESWAQRISALQNLPSEKEILENYYKYIKRLDREGNAYKTAIRELKAHCLKEVPQINIKDIYDYLEEDCTERDDPNGRWNKERNKFFHFWKWLHRIYKIENIIDYVETRRPRAKEDPHWHTIDEVEEAVSVLDPYWKTIVRVKAYSGLCSKEMRGMRNDDFYQDGTNWFFRVKFHEDRATKTFKRVRNVVVHPTRLLPTMFDYLQSKKKSQYLFPSTTPGNEMWDATGFSKELNSRIPEDMDALSLRRTFGSLMIRSGKSEEQVAAAMGNSPEIVRRHYGRILGKEVDVDF